MTVTAIPEVVIPLAQVPENGIAGRKHEFQRIVNEEYVTKILDHAGINSTKQIRQLVERIAPLGECDIQAVWGDGSAVAGELRIAQPTLTKRRPAIQEQREDVALPPRTQSSSSSRRGKQVPAPKLHMLSVVEPEVPNRDNVRQWLGIDYEEQERRRQRDYDDRVIAEAFHRMAEHDSKASEEPNSRLVDEVERLRGRLKIKADGSKHWVQGQNVAFKAEAQQQSLVLLKKKYILPFACVRSLERQGADGPEVVPWQVLEVCQAVPLPECQKRIGPPAEAFREEASCALNVSMKQIRMELHRISDKGLPLHLLNLKQDEKLFASVTQTAVSEDFAQLVGLLAHKLYWESFGHLQPEDARLPESTASSLLVSVHDAWYKLTASFRETPAGVRVALPALVLALKRGLERIFSASYPTCFADEDLTTWLIDRINVMIMQLIDPDCSLANFASFDLEADAIQLWKRYRQALTARGFMASKRSRARMERMTPMMLKALSSGTAAPSDPRTRVALRKSASDTTLAPASTGDAKPGSRKAQAQQTLDSRSRSALLRAAKQRVAQISEKFGSMAGLMTGSESSPTASEAAATMGLQSKLPRSASVGSSGFRFSSKNSRSAVSSCSASCGDHDRRSSGGVGRKAKLAEAWAAT
eukprot:TRINITY_DN53622_c0_g1_i1.p1 TRINITY_DN53622_c0_g1~~TRINITY_DN53622_c0_g1_i1.p1  ORF type:complete len:644 (+),score=149.26 TRINITY_DN53622_c0_g1_i1:100-2031(+)